MIISHYTMVAHNSQIEWYQKIVSMHKIISINQITNLWDQMIFKENLSINFKKQILLRLHKQNKGDIVMN